MEMINSRNQTSHTYIEEVANEIYIKILDIYYPAFLAFKNKMEDENEIDDLLLPFKVDISVFSKIENHDLIDHINRIGKVLYERDG